MKFVAQKTQNFLNASALVRRLRRAFRPAGPRGGGYWDQLKGRRELAAYAAKEFFCPNRTIWVRVAGKRTRRATFRAAEAI